MWKGSIIIASGRNITGAFSVSALERYQDCPFKFFASDVLRLEEVPEDCFVLIDATRADFIDLDVVEVIEDFMKHAHLKNIKVELKKSTYKAQGFAEKSKINLPENNIA